MHRFSVLALALGCAVAAKAPLPSNLEIDVQTDTAADGMGAYQGMIDLCGGTSDDALSAQNGVHFYRFDGEGCSDADIELRSLEGEDMVLVIFEPSDGDWIELARNDDCGSLTQSCIRQGLPVGEYIVGVTTYGRSIGDGDIATEYSLRVSCHDEFACASLDCTSDDECGPGRFCGYERNASCGETGSGVCQLYPDGCSADFAEVCGCDGNTYANECAAGARGVSVAGDAACGIRGDGGEGDACEGGEFPGCRSGLRCDFSALSGCDVVAAGVCSRDAEVFCPEVVDPVCGCDGRTYDNSCLRRAAGVAEDHDGEC